MAPLSFDLIEAARNHALSESLIWERVRNWDSIYLALTGSEPYLAVQTDCGDTWIARGEIPSQFFRRVIAAAIGQPGSFDWREDPGLEQVRRTVARLARTGVQPERALTMV
jgi:hypothetical protein